MKLKTMIKILFVSLLLTIALSAFAQKTTDFTTYDVVAKAGDVSIIVTL